MLPRKRSSQSSLDAGKRLRSGDSDTSGSGDTSQDQWNWTSVDEALAFFRRTFPVSSFTERIPPIVWRHMLYAIKGLGLRTEINRQLDQLVAAGSIRLFKLGSTFNENSTAIIFLEDYEKAIKEKYPNRSSLIDKFLAVVRDVTHPVFEREDLKCFSDSDTKKLVQMGVLAGHRMVSKFLLSMPGCGTFITSQTIGRKAVLRIIKSTRFKEILEVELWTRKVPAESRFDVRYFTTELLGSDEISVTETPTGRLFRCA